MSDENPKFSYETAFQRLEKILSVLNEGTVSLDESLQLFEEANQLIGSCSKQLNNAERKIETLIKGRDNQPILDQDGNPQLDSFAPPKQAHLNQNTGELS